MIDERFRTLIKAESENQILQNNWGISAWLAPISSPNLRDLNEVVDRFLVMSALFHVSQGMPLGTILGWLKRNNRLRAITKKEKSLLRRVHHSGVTPLIQSFFDAYADALWSFLWVLCSIEDFSALLPPENMPALLPNIESRELSQSELGYTYMRPMGDLYAMLDFYYRLHWYCVDQTTSGKADLCPPESRIYQRRKVLEWVYNKNSSWDEALPSF